MTRHRCLLVLVGPLCAGKTTLASGLLRDGWTVVTARSAIEAAAGKTDLSRAELQRLGLQLETERPGLWLRDAVESVDASAAVVDSARTQAQVVALRSLSPTAVVAFVTASRDVRRARFAERSDLADAGEQFDEIADTPLERGVEALVGVASITLDTSSLGVDRAMERLRSIIGLY